MGEIAARYGDMVIVTDDNPRSEDPAAIRAEVLKGAPHMMSPTSVSSRRCRKTAARKAIAGHRASVHHASGRAIALMIAQKKGIWTQ